MLRPSVDEVNLRLTKSADNSDIARATADKGSTVVQNCSNQPPQMLQRAKMVQGFYRQNGCGFEDLIRQLTDHIFKLLF
jgi:hypothetical protein